MSSVAETVGDRIRKVRGSLSQEEFASRLGVHKETLGKYERGKIVPGGDVLARVHDEFSIDINWLLTGRSNQSEQKANMLPPVAPRIEPDEDLMRAIGNGIDTVYREAGARLGPGDLVRLAARIHADIVNSGACTPEESGAALRALLERLRRDLHQPPSASAINKGSA